MTEHPDYARIARALNNVATTLQQLAVECDIAAQAHRVAIPPGQLSVEELREQLAAGMVTVPYAKDRLPVVTGATKASLAEPECGCSLYSRCDQHEAERSKVCTCNGPRFASTSCRIAVHAEQARRMPDRDPSLVD